MNIPTEIMAIAQRMATQNNECTAHAMFCVQKCERIGGLDSAYSDQHEWRGVEYNLADAEETKRLDAIYDDTFEEPDGWTRNVYYDKWETVMVSLTRKGCEDYIAANGHNISQIMPPRIYVESFYRNREMIALREWLLSLAKVEK